MTPFQPNHELVEQLSWHWNHHLRRRFEGMTDDEYLWEPAPGSWSLRRRGEAVTSMAAGGGELVADFEVTEPDPAPVTTIAWRLAHLNVGIFGERLASHFGGEPVSYETAVWPSSADDALAWLDRNYDAWIEGVAALGDDGLHRPCGPAEGPFADHPLGALVLHINREVIHHGAEICVLRDLYGARHV